MAQDFLSTYKYGWKTSYYQNTYDMSTDSVEEDAKEPTMDDLLAQLEGADDDCDSCKIWVTLL